MKPDAREIAPVNQQEKGLLPIPDKQGPLAVLILTDSGAAAASAFRNCSANRPPRIPRLSPAKLKRSLPIPEKQRFRPSGHGPGFMPVPEEHSFRSAASLQTAFLTLQGAASPLRKLCMLTAVRRKQPAFPRSIWRPAPQASQAPPE